MNLNRIVINAFNIALLGVAFAASASVSASETAGKTKEINKTVTYQNQRGSILTLTWHDSQQDKTLNFAGSLSGTFTSAVGKCATGTTIPVSGYYNGNTIALTFSYPQCKKVVAMTGNVTSDKDEIHTLWLVAANAADPQKDDWDANVTGADHFEKKD